MEQIKIYESRFLELIKFNVHCVHLETATQVDEPSSKAAENLEITENPTVTLTCSFCKIKFSDVSNQREHYKLDWHRYNLKRNMSGREPLTEEQFSEKNSKLASKEGHL